MTRRISAMLLPGAAIVALAAGGVAALVDGAALRDAIWLAALVVTGAPLLWRTMREARRGHFATDIVASLSIVGAIVLHQPLAGLVIVLMQSGGAALERYAEGRASAAVRDLEQAAPRIAHRVAGERVEDVPVDAIRIGDVLVIRPGEFIVCDGVITDGHSDLDTAALTGEPMPVDANPGVAVLSGTINGAGLLRIRAGALASESQYSRIVELVRNAQASKAPVQRMADRYAVWFTPMTIAVCVLTFAAVRDWNRVLAVLVVATPCPLILAAPTAIVGGISRAARRGIILRNGGALEHLAEVDTAVFDKTGTITLGDPQVQAVRSAGAFARATVLGLAASVEQASGHLLARVTVAAAHSERLALAPVSGSREEAGRGVSGQVAGHSVQVGGRAFVLSHVSIQAAVLAKLEATPAALRAYVAIDGVLAGTIEYADVIRPDLRTTLDRLRATGIRRMMLLSGDHEPAVRAMAQAAGFSESRGDLLPGDKAGIVAGLRRDGHRVMMVGDGTNDAPALTAADVGIALASRGGGVTAEAADVVLLVDKFERIADAVEIGQRAIRITRQSIWAGLGMSAAAMVIAALGFIPPATGAILQEGIDVAVILNALRSSRA